MSLSYVMPDWLFNCIWYDVFSRPSGVSNFNWAMMHPCVSLREFSVTSTPNCTISPDDISYGSDVLMRCVLINVPLLLPVSYVRKVVYPIYHYFCFLFFFFILMHFCCLTLMKNLPSLYQMTAWLRDKTLQSKMAFDSSTRLRGTERPTFTSIRGSRLIFRV